MLMSGFKFMILCILASLVTLVALLIACSYGVSLDADAAEPGQRAGSFSFEVTR